MTALADGEHALAAYEALAPHYDAFTAHHDYDAWTRDLEALARRHGLRGRRLLDVACGTGKSFAPYLDRGYSVVGCDASPAMLARARRRAGGRAALHVRDMRTLPRLGAFDLVTLLDDAVNYLHDAAELTAAFAGVARNLAPGGIALFDANTLRMYAGFFAASEVVERDGALIVWRGRCPAEPDAGVLVEATVDVVTAGGERIVSRHLQRHHPEPQIRDALRAAGLRCLAVHGQTETARFEPGLDESRHLKGIYLATHHESGERR